VTTRLSQNSSNLEHVLNGEVKQHKVHGTIDDVVVLNELVIGAFLELNEVKDLNIGSISKTKLSVNITEQETSELIDSIYFSISIVVKMTKKTVELLTKWLLAAFFDCSFHPHTILVIDKSVTEDSACLVSP
jgi:hypothetical protein